MAGEPGRRRRGRSCRFGEVPQHFFPIGIEILHRTVAPDGQHHGGPAQQADVVPVGMGLPPLRVATISASGGPAIGDISTASSHSLAWPEDSRMLPMAGPSPRGCSDAPGRPSDAAGLRRCAAAFQVHVRVGEAINPAIHGAHGAEHLIDDGCGDDVTVLGGDPFDPGPAGADPGQAGTEQLAAGHVVLMERPGVLDDVGRIGRPPCRGRHQSC